MPSPERPPTLPFPIRIGAAYWVQRTDWASLREAILAAEAAGADSLWIDDHLLCDEGDPDDPKLEGWTTLAAVAAITQHARLGLLVAANTVRNPGLTAKLAVTVDQVSGGRAILGLGGGWFEREHEAFGIDFGGGFGERLDRLDEATGLIRRLLDGERVTHAGTSYTLTDAICEPRPVQAHLPILIGGSGPRKTLRIVARHADIWNSFGTPDSIAASAAILGDHCAAIGRDPATIERTFCINVVARATRAEAESAWESYRAVHKPSEGEGRLAVGTPAEIAADLAPYARIGFTHPILVFRSPWDIETLARLGEIREALEAALSEGASILASYEGPSS
ncbi:MAG TPA: LLM class flavin-dependent oxidoreductase [Candidatus Limnocylindrales bacterium]|jgi:alkanesulfonate monooxygenase SsuD/methylene tetrahydromethanopterin reductase-like flavin-dependent oxidoreductase (luciferase family)|nr:LLM class flavin-dependent oxidoreductase [Candidatus Limnocylindrales bacterium]